MEDSPAGADVALLDFIAHESTPAGATRLGVAALPGQDLEPVQRRSNRNEVVDVALLAEPLGGSTDLSRNRLAGAPAVVPIRIAEVGEDPPEGARLAVDGLRAAAQPRQTINDLGLVLHAREHAIGKGLD